MSPSTKLPRAYLEKEWKNKATEELSWQCPKILEAYKKQKRISVMCNLQVWREDYPQLTITNNTKLLKNTFLNCFCIVQDNLTRWVLIFTWHINIKKFFQGTTFIFDFEKPRKNLNSCLWKYKRWKSAIKKYRYFFRKERHPFKQALYNFHIHGQKQHLWKTKISRIQQHTKTTAWLAIANPTVPNILQIRIVLYNWHIGSIRNQRSSLSNPSYYLL